MFKTFVNSKNIVNQEFFEISTRPSIPNPYFLIIGCGGWVKSCSLLLLNPLFCGFFLIITFWIYMIFSTLATFPQTLFELRNEIINKKVKRERKNRVKKIVKVFEKKWRKLQRPHLANTAQGCERRGFLGIEMRGRGAGGKLQSPVPHRPWAVLRAVEGGRVWIGGYCGRLGFRYSRDLRAT